MSNLEIIAVIVNVIGVWLTVRRNYWCWPVGIIGVLLYAKIFFDYKLYGDMLLQTFFFFTQLYGWFQWRHGLSESEQTVTIVGLARRQGVLHVLVGAVGGLLLGLTMAHFTDASVPWLDAQLTAFSLVASLWAARKHVANWILWIVLDAIYVGMYIYKDLTLTAWLYAGFVGLAVYGWYQWTKARQAIVPTVELATAQ